MSNNRKRWLAYEVLEAIVICGAVVLVPNMPMWKYLVLGLCFGLYAGLNIRQDRL
jgi:hypothetical protein